MIKKLLSTVILVLAITIFILNIWNPFKEEPNNNELVMSSEDITEDETISGVDLSQVQEGKLAPDFELETLNGEKLKLSDYRGKKVILNFWATWCPPCKAEMPHMQNFYEENKDNGIEIVAVNLTNIDKGQQAIETFVDEYELSFQIPLDKDGLIGPQFQAFTIPTSYIIDSHGIITKKVIGPMDENMMMNLTKDIE